MYNSHDNLSFGYHIHNLHWTRKKPYIFWYIFCVFVRRICCVSTRALSVLFHLLFWTKWWSMLSNNRKRMKWIERERCASHSIYSFILCTFCCSQTMTPPPPPSNPVPHTQIQILMMQRRINNQKKKPIDWTPKTQILNLNTFKWCDGMMEYTCTMTKCFARILQIKLKGSKDSLPFWMKGKFHFPNFLHLYVISDESTSRMIRETTISITNFERKMGWTDETLCLYIFQLEKTCDKQILQIRCSMHWMCTQIDRHDSIINREPREKRKIVR